MDSSHDLQAEWESFEAMIGGAGGVSGDTANIQVSGGYVTYPGLNIPLPGENTSSKGII